MKSFLGVVAIASAALTSLPVVAQDSEAGAVAAPTPVEPDDLEDLPGIVVSRSANERAVIRALARDVVGQIKGHEPLPRFHGEFCVEVAGVKGQFVEDFRARIIENARLARVRIDKDDCKPNALVIFTTDARNELRKLRKTRPALLGNLPPSARDRLLNSRDPAFAFQATQVLGANGIVLGIDERDTPDNNVFGPNGRLSLTYSITIAGAVVLIDADAVEGKTATQLADYASLRLLMPTGEIKAITPGMPPTIMTLFLDPENAPPELTDFDLGFLRAGYSLAPNMAASGLFGQTERAMSDPKAR